MTKTIDYTGLSHELEQLFERLEGGTLGIDEAVQAYERGMAIVGLLETHLQTAENRINALKDAADTSAGV